MLFEIKNYADFQTAVEDFCAFLLRNAVSREKVFDSKLVVHELLGNVLQHSQGGARLTAEVCGEYLQITVRADEHFCPPSLGRCPDVFSERGRGLYLVDKMSAERSFTEEGEIVVRIRLFE